MFYKELDRTVFSSLFLFLLFSIFTIVTAQTHPEKILLKNYKPRSVYKIPRTEIKKARFPVIDMHSHPYAKGDAQIDQWIKNMDQVGIEKTVILTAATGAKFDSIYAKYAGRYPDRFEVWCGFDYTGYDKPGYGPAASILMIRVWIPC